MTTNTILGILMAVAIIGFLNSVRNEGKEYRSTDKFAVKGLMKKLSKAGATDVLHANETGLVFVSNETSYYLDGRYEPATTLYAVYELNESVDLEKARAVAFLMSSSCKTLSIQIKETREIIVGCTTIIPDATSLWNVIPYMIGFLERSINAFFEQYQKDSETKEESN